MKANKKKMLLCRISRYKFTASGVTYINSLPFRDRWIRVSDGQDDVNAWSQLLGRFSIIFYLFFVESMVVGLRL